MEKIDRRFITDNIIRLIDFSGIDDVHFAHIIEKSTRTVARIRNGDALLSIENINIAADFFKKDLTVLNTQIVEYEYDFRNTLKELHKNNLQYYNILEKTPSITYAIKYYLIENEDFRKKGFIVDQINDFFKSYNWEYESAYISSAMTRNEDLVFILTKTIINGKTVNIYSAK